MTVRTDDHHASIDAKKRILTEIKARRAKAGRLIAGVGAVADSDNFKGPGVGKPKSKCWDAHLSPESKNRPPVVLKEAIGKYLKKPDMIYLGGGIPPSEHFPYTEMSFCVPAPSNFSEEDVPAPVNRITQTAKIGKYDFKDGISEYDLSIGLNYGQATGSPQMVRFVTEHTELVYNPAYADWKVCLTVGSTAATEQVVRLLCDHSRGDSILTEEYSFATALQTFTPQKIGTFGVEIDDEGLIPERMDEILSNWDQEARGARKPHVLYTVPSGQNPTGATQSLRRRSDIYTVCQKHNIFIIEDEPYYFIQMPPYKVKKDDWTPQEPESVESFLAGLVPSYLTIDVDGRVLRMDSFSKVLAPGSRLGWITASSQIVEKFIRHAEVANQGPSGISQLMLWKLLDETWGHEGYLKWLIHLKDNFTRRRDMLLDACEQYLPKTIVSWNPPASGMFVWLRIDHSKHPDYPSRSIEDIEEQVFNCAVNNGVLCARGSWFKTEPIMPAKGIFLRITFASPTEEAMSKAMERLGRAVRDCYKI